MVLSIIVLVGILVVAVLFGLQPLVKLTKPTSTAKEAEPFAAGEAVSFFTAKETNDYLVKDEDKYVTRLTAQDLSARGVSTTTEYLQVVATTGLTFSDKEKTTLRNAATKADEMLSQFYGLGVVGSKTQNIHWCFAKVGDAYENGLPHTRSNVIFVPVKVISYSHKELISTLIHEKVHLYQRLYPEDIQAYLEFAGYIQWKERQFYPLARSNPDIDPFVYIHPSTKQPMVALYASDTPKSISDVLVSSDYKNEHPYEEIAYAIATI